jgi:hypothetical protein
MVAKIPIPSVLPTYKSDKSANRIDIALLVSALFLQRFSLPFGKMLLQLDLVLAMFILSHQFLSGRLLIKYDRFLWFLVLALAATSSLLLNLKSASVNSYFLFLVLSALVTLSRPSTPDQYKGTLQVFQFLMMLLSCLAVVQFVAQFMVDGRKLISFFGLVPDFLLGTAAGWNTTHPIEGSSLLKSNGIFLNEPSTFSQITAIGILIEVLEFRRPRYLVVMALGFLLAYSGTGLMTLLLVLPLAGLRHGKAGLSALFVIMLALGLFATGIIDLSVFVSRTGEFEQTGTSGFSRFVSPFWLAAKHIDTASLQELLIGSGPGTAKTFDDPWYGGGSYGVVFKLFCDYGILGAFIYVCFLASCVRRSRCPGLVLVALIFTHTFLVGFLTTWLPLIIAVLCTLHDPERGRGRIVDARRYGPPLVAGSAAG